jgi:hypothetical protein
MTDRLAEGAYGFRKPLKIEQDLMNGFVTIEGTRISYELLLTLGQNDQGIGHTLRIEKKGNGDVVMFRMQRCPQCGLDLDAWKDGE